MKENFQAQIILVTGAGSGIGRTTAIELARAGHIVYASMRVADLEGERWASLRSVGLEERLNLRPLELDVRGEASCRGKRKGVSQVKFGLPWIYGRTTRRHSDSVIINPEKGI